MHMTVELPKPLSVQGGLEWKLGEGEILSVFGTELGKGLFLEATWTIMSTTLLLWPNSLSHQEMSLIKWSLRAMLAPAPK